MSEGTGPARRLHPDEIDTDAALVERLIETQFPFWADRAIAPVGASGTDHALYRLGDDMVVRLPRVQRATDQVDKEHVWLPKLAPQLPLTIPQPLAKGAPAENYPWVWSVYRWIEGETAASACFEDPRAAAVDLAAFITALRALDAADAPGPGRHNFWRGGPLVVRDQATRAAIAALAGVVDTGAATRAWEAALSAPAWSAAPVWIHGDMMPGNLLAANGRLNAVIDFGGLGAGDPACDLMAAWTLFAGDARAAFREALGADEATWARGRGWALHISLVGLPYYRSTFPDFAALAARTIEAVLADHAARRGQR